MNSDWAAVVAGALEVDVRDDFGLARVDVDPASWVDAVRAARDRLGCTFFDWLTAVDELPDGYRLVCHLAVPPGGGAPMRALLLRTLMPRDEPAVASVAAVFAGAGWHEREVAEMFGVRFTDAETRGGDRLLLPAGFEGHPLRKDFVLASRVAAPWPGAKEPGESDASLAGQTAAGRTRSRRSRPPGVPEPGRWGPREPGPTEPATKESAPARRSRRGGAR